MAFSGLIVITLTLEKRSDWKVVKCHFETQLEHHLVLIPDNTLWGWDNVLQDVQYALNC